MSQRKSSMMFPLIERYLSTDANPDQFCKANDLKKYVLYYWLKKYNKAQEQKADQSFQPIEITEAPITSSSNIIIRYPNGTELIIPFSC